jgi:hypothetical protein
MLSEPSTGLRDLARRRLANHHLTGAPFATPAEAVAWLGAVQAQDYAGAKWGIGQRARAGADADLEDALQTGQILRTHVLRPTWHFVLPADIRWLLELTAPRIHAASAYYHRQVELDAATFARSNAVLARAVTGHNYLTREELGRALAGAGVAATGVRLGYLVMRAELEGVLVSGPRRGKQLTYALLDERVPAAPVRSREAALGELTRRYFTSHGPATAADFAWWSGLPSSDVKLGLEMNEGLLREEVVDGARYWFARSRRRVPDGPPLLHLLPNFDEYLVAYENHRVAIDPELEKKLRAHSNVLRGHIVLLDGRIIGGWRRTLRKGHVSIEVTPVGDVSRTTKQAVRDAADRYGRHLVLTAEVKWA